MEDLNFRGVVNQSFKEEKDPTEFCEHNGHTTFSFGAGKTRSVWLKVVIAVVVTALLTATIVLAVCFTGNCDTSGPCNLDCDADSIGWGYEDDNGAECWSSCYTTCGESSQSPINLDTASIEDITYTPLTMTGYDRTQAFSMYNNGHTVSVSIKDSGNRIEDLGLPSVYEAYQFHFHWGETSSRGSEHTINGRAYPMEMHVVHYNTDYPSPDEAASQPQGLAVLGFMFTVSPDDNPAFDFIVSNLNQIPYKDSAEVDLQDQELQALLPDDMQHFFRYSGSLTTPPCSEIVVWTVFTTPIAISEQQLSEFRSLSTGHEGDSQKVALVDTYRPPQPRNGRTLYYGNNS